MFVFYLLGCLVNICYILWSFKDFEDAMISTYEAVPPLLQFDFRQVFMAFLAITVLVSWLFSGFLLFRSFKNI